MLVDLKKDLKELDAADFYKKYLLGQDIWYFKEKDSKNYLINYDDFKHNVADNLGIPFNNISIVGSAKIGHSLSPKKNFKKFDEDSALPAWERSDMDLVLVSQDLFYEFWDAYLDLYFEKRRFDYQFVTSCVFRRFISVKKIDPIHPTFRDWIERVENFNKDYQVLFDITCDINYRIYDSWESVEDYHFKGINELKEKLSP
jgi:hypothetical protein